MKLSSSDHWRKKINALLHDTPDKATDIRSHEQRAAQIKGIHQFVFDEYFDKSADWSASAADRLPFPTPAQLTQPLSGISNFPHPLGGASLPNLPFKSAEEALEITQKSHPFLINSDDSQAAFIAIWRFWRNWAVSLDPRFTRLPADTRIPDHTIWNHLNITTAFQGAKSENGAAPRLLLFSIGPVQDLIAAARSTRDLWSGSYLLSYLVSHALGKIAREIGPDHVIFPNLLDQPLIDLQLKDIYQNINFSDAPVWDGFQYTGDKLSTLLTPSLPNRFMALLPAVHPENGKSTEDYAAEIAKSVRAKLNEIGQSVTDFLQKHQDKEICTFDAKAFQKQTERILEIQWQTLPIPKEFDELYTLADQLLPEDNTEAKYTPRAAVDAIKKMIEIPACKPQYEPLRPETGWALLNALIAFLHDGVKSNRAFDAWREGRWDSGKKFNKDALNGKEEAVLHMTPNETAAQSYSSTTLGLSRGTLKPGELLGASTLIKRFWHHTYLPKALGITPRELRERHPMPNTHAVAAGEPFSDADEESESRDQREKYFAILALDGDEMGKWVSGSLTPKNSDVLSPEAEDFYRKNAPEFLNAHRAVTPSWHLQFAEALGNFSFQAVQRIVEAFDGRLIYAGGDDVLAMLPAKDAVNCARALRAAFRGEPALNEMAKGALYPPFIPNPQNEREKKSNASRKSNRHTDQPTQLFNIQQEGFLQLHPHSGAAHGAMKGLISDPVDFPALVPGPRADVSVGIAIAHFKAPLQDVVRAAQAAEKRAKRSEEKGGLNRAAVAISLYKRSGEIVHWGAKWDSGGLELYQAIAQKLDKKSLSSKFPHRVCQLLDAYRNDLSPLVKASGNMGDADEFDARAIMEKEFAFAVARQSSSPDEARRNAEDLQPLLDVYLSNIPQQIQTQLESLSRLCITVAFAHRTKPEDSNHQSTAERQMA